jgi:NSS family neurotransmitter:Na+ symporter
MQSTSKAPRATFATKLGAIAAAVGSAVGLGNIWRFPFVTGENGGAAFLIIYVCAVVLLGIPLIISEFLVGRTAHSNAAGSFKILAPGTRWYWIGTMGVLVATLILAYYNVIAGWTLEYIWTAVTNGFARMVSEVQLLNPDREASEIIAQNFTDFSTSAVPPICWMTLFILINALILLGGVKKGIERASSIMMPVLFLLLIVLCINSTLLDGFREGVDFLFHPDFSKITGRTFLIATGQAFFSLSAGMGTLITYGSYLGDNTKLGKTALSIAGLDTLIAVLAGIVIFPACFSFGIRPEAGPGLVFITLPNVFVQMTGGYLWCILFFLLVALAALTSTMSIYEPPIAWLQEEFHLSRRRAILITVIVTWILGVACSMSMGGWSDIKIFGQTFFELCDTLTASYMMPIGSMFIALFVGWKLDRAIIRDAITNRSHDSGWYIRPLIFLLRYFAPIAILKVFLSGLGFFDWIDRLVG